MNNLPKLMVTCCICSFICVSLLIFALVIEHKDMDADIQYLRTQVQYQQYEIGQLTTRDEHLEHMIDTNLELIRTNVWH